MEETIEDLVKRMILNQTENETISNEDTFESLGLGDLDIVEVVIDIELEKDIEITDEELNTLSNKVNGTVQDLIDLVNSKAN